MVARFREDLAWLRRVPRAVQVTVYDKGGDAVSAAPLPNVGREAHTYLHHLAGRYEELAPVTVFAQGKPFDHVPDLHRLLRRIAAGELAVRDFLWLGFLIDRDDADGHLLFQRWSKNPDCHPLPLRDFWRRIWAEEAPAHVMFYPGAHFAVTAEQVRRQPRAFYERALHLSAELPEAAHCFERCWDRVFGVEGIPEEYRGRPLPLYFKPIKRLGACRTGCDPR